MLSSPENANFVDGYLPCSIILNPYYNTNDRNWVISDVQKTHPMSVFQSVLLISCTSLCPLYTGKGWYEQETVDGERKV